MKAYTYVYLYMYESPFHVLVAAVHLIPSFIRSPFHLCLCPAAAVVYIPETHYPSYPHGVRVCGSCCWAPIQNNIIYLMCTWCLCGGKGLPNVANGLGLSKLLSLCFVGILIILCPMYLMLFFESAQCCSCGLHFSWYTLLGVAISLSRLSTVRNIFESNVLFHLFP